MRFPDFSPFWYSLLDTWVFHCLPGGVAPRAGPGLAVRWGYPHCSPMCSACASWPMGLMLTSAQPTKTLPNLVMCGAVLEALLLAVQNRCRELWSQIWKEMVLPLKISKSPSADELNRCYFAISMEGRIARDVINACCFSFLNLLNILNWSLFDYNISFRCTIEWFSIF